MGTDVNIMAPVASAGANAKQGADVRLKPVPPLAQVLDAIEKQQQEQKRA